MPKKSSNQPGVTTAAPASPAPTGSTDTPAPPAPAKGTGVETLPAEAATAPSSADIQASIERMLSGTPPPAPTGQEPSPAPAAEETQEFAADTPADEAPAPTGEDAEAEPAAETAPVAEVGAETEDQEPEANPFRERMDRYKRQRDEAREEVEELRTQLKAVEEKPRPVNTPASVNDPLAGVNTMAELNQSVASAQQVKTWARQQMQTLRVNPESVEAALKAAKVTLPEYTPEAMRDWLEDIRDNASETLTMHVPRRAQYLQNREAWNETARAEFPFLAKKDDPNHRRAQLVRQRFPSIEALEDGQFWLGVIARGLEAVDAQRAARSKPAAAAAPAKPPPKPALRTAPPSAPALPPRQDPRDGVMTEARRKMLEDGDATEYIAASLKG